MSNPFPGLRPFQLEESHLFFGREEQTGQLLERLGNTRFLAVVGASGSGKSSLVRAGLLPQLYGGTMVKTSVHWEIAIMRPGGDPITNLARCLVEADIYKDNSEDQVQLLRTMLSRSGLGLLEAYRQSDIEPGSNLLILVDQFEEEFAEGHARRARRNRHVDRAVAIAVGVVDERGVAHEKVEELEVVASGNFVRTGGLGSDGFDGVVHRVPSVLVRHIDKLPHLRDEVGHVLEVVNLARLNQLGIAVEQGLLLIGERDGVLCLLAARRRQLGGRDRDGQCHCDF